MADVLSRRKGHAEVSDAKTLNPLFTAPMTPTDHIPFYALDPLCDETMNVIIEKKDHSPIFNTFAEYKRRLIQGEEPAKVGNGSYALKNDTLCKKIFNQWGAEIEVEVFTTLDDARNAIEKLHCDLGHLGRKMMLAALCTRYSIPYAQEMVEQCIQSCDLCQFLQRAPPPSQPLHPIPRVNAGDVWAFNFIGPLPKTLKGNQYLLTAMDLSTDWTIAQALPHRSGQSVLEMLQYIMYTYGKPLRILTDNGEEFMSYRVQGMLQRFGIRHDHTTPYHPQTNGWLEKFNDVLTQMLARMTTLQQQTSWDHALLDALLAHRAHTSSSMGVSPFFLMYG